MGGSTVVGTQAPAKKERAGIWDDSLHLCTARDMTGLVCSACPYAEATASDTFSDSLKCLDTSGFFEMLDVLLQ